MLEWLGIIFLALIVLAVIGKIMEKKAGPNRVGEFPKPRSVAAIDVLKFTYEDQSGNITFRTVDLYGVTDTYMEGLCHSRKAIRTFRFDRVMGSITSLETGEIFVAPADVFRAYWRDSRNVGVMPFSGD